MAFLDLCVPQAVVAQRVLGTEEVRGVQTEHTALTLRFDRADWPKAPRDALAAGNHSRLARLAIRARPDPRPHGLILAEVWIDQHGMLRRYSSTARPRHGSHPKAHRVTTGLWDFGGPPPIADRASQAVIDPDHTETGHNLAHSSPPAVPVTTAKHHSSRPPTVTGPGHILPSQSSIGSRTLV